MTPLIPTQADREAAAANILARLKFQHGGEQPWMDASTQSMRMGEQDDHWEVQAFAAHRIAACNSHGELVEALEKIIGGKCPECKGWGEVAYFGEMVACKCNGQYLPTPSHADIAKARAALAKAKGEAL